MFRTAALLSSTALIAMCGSVLLGSGGANAADAKLVQVEDPYFKNGKETLRRILHQQKNTSQAKNVILFIADGMGFSTVTAARILEGQQRGVDGESNVLTFEAFPYLAASKTYSSDGQVADSSPTAVAMVTGVKTRNASMAVASTVPVGDCEAALAAPVTTIFEMAQTAGLATGLVSTARITHATPGATQSHVPSRDWESDADMPPEAIAAGCVDIARSLVEAPHGHGFDVAMGGGRAYFLPDTVDDPEDEGKTGRRKDGRDLTKAWTSRHGEGSAFVWNKEQFDAIDPATTGPVLGLFSMSHMSYDIDREKDKAGEPSLAEMTAKAIEILQHKGGDEGFILMVEGGRVDHGLHDGNAARALTDAIAFDRAIRTATEMVDLDETLIVATADHSHTLTINGYPQRGNPILGLASWDGEPLLGDDGKPYTTLSFANGPGAPAPGTERADLSEVDTTDVDFLQQSLVPLNSETHGGEDLGIYAIGPWAHLFQGTVEQNYIFHVMDHASKISERAAARQE